MAIIFFPLAVIGLVNGTSAIGEIIETLLNGLFPVGLGGAVFRLAIGVVFVAAEYSVVSQIFEANRRLKTLRDHPERTVRKLSAPFQSSLFGPYH